ncbi:MAG: glycyl-radical enzyme activating protein [Clostridia bacterium]|nr:glycyl-radical enzyme activating protein [Clostridia bacterium]
MELKISNIQNFSIHDGTGIRTVIFLAGCPLRCVWCHNPEAISQRPTLLFDRDACIGCRFCDCCGRGVHTFTPEHIIHRTDCVSCFECVGACPTGALSPSVRVLGREDFHRTVEKHIRLFGREGGITFSGGEPLLQADGILSMLDGVDIHTAIETSGYADEEVFCRVIERMDLVMLDLKLADDGTHRRYTGVSNEKILRNLDNLRHSGKPFILRTPMIPNITDTEENLSALSKIVGSDPWERLPYNKLTPAKYERLGLDFSL